MNEEIQRKWSAETDSVLRAAGWHPGRSISTAAWESALHEHDGFEIHEAARRFLAEFGGLAVPARGAGRTMARMEINLDPTLATWDAEIFEVLSEEAGSYLYPIGMIDRRNGYLGMAPDGTVFTGMDSVTFFADNADEALEKLIEGIR
ncbi:SUKH-3 domain-containing protein [Streptomyces sp. H27-C3]|uniref:SUKH-3 domain-containing protein n=1 Tax=Streptomyces sp. H27-C3 TaxID=3046305 RepID=UPI0024BA10C0|nr:SUKH-3 domain-containing protein [Streptomyces sp. H27-C3]MDJ0464430.1 SUKH-3 domain-containing protein [Streptomyces sp. H27-C3]